jgi:hypothetical protein
MSLLRMRTRRLTPYVDPLAREVSNPHRALVGWFIEEAEAAPPDEAKEIGDPTVNRCNENRLHDA